MSHLPRIAVGTIADDADATALVWGLMAALEAVGQHVQSFRGAACFSPRDGATVITGRAQRHLDSWLMTPDACRQTLLTGTTEERLALVEGQFNAACADTRPSGSRLEPICEWLNLPRLAVIDVSQLTRCRVPQRPDADGLLLDRISSESELYRAQTLLETLWKIPVLGAMEEAESLRIAIGQLAPGERPQRWLGEALGNAFARLSDLERIRRLASARPFPYRRTPSECPSPNWRSLRVAVAWDDAFYCYFPDTLDRLEARGATLCDFSPLGDERLPDGVDIVYLGCGHPQRFAQALAENQCLAASLRQHVCNGQRIYAEGGGLAYLCEQIELADGRRLPMAGVLPAIARENSRPHPPAPHTLELRHAIWLGPEAARLRGYLSDNWQVEPTGALRVDGQAGGRLDLVGRHQAIGSCVHLNFATDPAVLDRFFAPHAAALELSAARTE